MPVVPCRSGLDVVVPGCPEGTPWGADGNSTSAASVAPAAEAFTVTWATQPAPSGYVYDVKVRRPGSTKWKLWQSDVTTVTATFVPDSGKGTYDFKAHIQKVSNGKKHDSV